MYAIRSYYALLIDFKMEIYIGSDHAGYNLKQTVKKHLEQKDIKVVDLGCFNGEESVDYPVIAREVCEKVLES